MRELLRVAALRLDLRLFLGYGLGERLPAHQTISEAQTQRFADGDVFERLFLRSVSLCKEHGLIEGSHLSVDGFHAEANAALRSLRASLEPIAGEVGREETMADEYTVKTRAWLDGRYDLQDDDGVYWAHQPIYGFRTGHSEPGQFERYLRTVRIMETLCAPRAATAAPAPAHAKHHQPPGQQPPTLDSPRHPTYRGSRCWMWAAPRGTRQHWPRTYSVPTW